MTSTAALELRDPDGAVVPLAELAVDDRGEPLWLIVQALRYYG
ncbi:MAG: hypothetical protein ACE5GB_06205 [Acidimicrobiales bacterium]